jgi:hemerythrin superfamily protein
MNARGAARTLGLATAMAIGVAAGVALSRSGRVAFKAKSRLHGDWLGHLRSEHRVIRKLLKSMSHAEFADPTRRAALLEKVADILTRHAVEEENVVYPALTAMGLDASHLVDDHAEMKLLIRALQSLPLEDVRWREEAKVLRRSFDKHSREEEEEIFPLLRETLPDDENAKLTKLVQREGVRLS